MLRQTLGVCEGLRDRTQEARRLDLVDGRIVVTVRPLSDDGQPLLLISDEAL